MIISLLLALQATAVAAQQNAEQIWQPSSAPRWTVGDDDRWARLRFQDSTWPVFRGLSSSPNGIFWIRQPLLIDGNDLASQNTVLSIEGTGAFDIYFDGRLLGSSGLVGATSAEEIPGPLRFDLGVPREFLTEGRHVIAVRTSAHQIRDPSDFFVSVELKSAQGAFIAKALNMVLLGVVFATIIFLSVFYAASSVSKEHPRVFIATFSATIGIGTIACIEAGKALGFTTYQWLFTSDMVAALASLLVFVAVPVILIIRLVKRRWWAWLTGLVIPLSASYPAWDNLEYEHDSRLFIGLCLYSLMLCGRTVSSQRKQALYYAFSLTTCLLGIIIAPDTMYVFLVALAVFLVLGFSIDIRARQVSAQRSLLEASRLEAEMLKRNIQPHFLMNSLTAISEWIETAPTDALRYIHGLADEFRSLSKLSSERLVPLADEIELCRTHLLLMGMRQKKTYALETDGLVGDETIPPGVFHTLIENALTHNLYRDGYMKFQLSKTETESEIQYSLSVPMGIDSGHKHSSTGAGTRYVTARLEESYPGQWSFSSKELHGRWLTIIIIRG